MKTLTPRQLQEFVYLYNYEITTEQAEKVLELLDNNLGTFTSTDIEEVTDYVVYDKDSMFAGDFE
jgi:hypothetical protein